MIRLGKGQIPILCKFQLSPTECCVVTRRKFQNATKHRLRVGHPEERQVLVERFGIEFCFNLRYLQQRFDFRSERKPLALVEIIERLDSEMIAGDEQRRRAGAQITDREGEHSVQPLYAVRTFLLIQVNDHLSVGVGSEAMALAFEFAAKFS